MKLNYVFLDKFLLGSNLPQYMDDLCIYRLSKFILDQNTVPTVKGRSEPLRTLHNQLGRQCQFGHKGQMGVPGANSSNNCR